MPRHIPWLAAAVLVFVLAPNPSAPAMQAKSGTDTEQKGDTTEAKLQFHAAQAALFSALAHASALVEFSDTKEGEMDLARSYVHTVNREIQACDGDSVKIGQAIHSAEKRDSMKTLRSELTEATKAIDEAQDAVDGHGTLGPHAKNAAAHLEKAMIALLKLGEDIGAKPLPSPGAKIVRDSRGR